MASPTPKEIRQCFQDYRSAWQETRDEAATDMRYIDNDPWDPDDRAAREQAGRPCLSLDELNQYINQYCNNLRKNKRAIQVMAKGSGANDADAQKRSSLIMGIEERSNAQLAYINAAQCAAERSYGFAVIRTEYKDFDSFDQEILIKPILNPDTVLLSPHYKQPDASDIADAFLLDLIPRAQFKKKYSKARITDFSGEEMASSLGFNDWVKEKYVQVGEYWKVQYKRRRLLLVDSPEGPVKIFEDELKEKSTRDRAGRFMARPNVKILRDRDVEIPYVMQYLTNGIEILDEIKWAGTRIPIIACFGKEMWMTQGGIAKRKLISMIRMARDAQMLYAFLATQECEEAGMIPKVPFVGYKGQFDSDQETWDELNKIPHAYAQVDILIDGANGQVLPIPERPSYQPNFQQYELAKDAAKRAIQSAMGIMPLPTAAQRQSEKSGIALEKIQDQEAIGSFHFTDNVDRFLHNMGWQVNELITPILDTAREMPITNPDKTRTTMHLVGNASHPLDEEGAYEVQDLPEEHLHTGVGEFDVTISTGPDHDSERQKESDFVDTLIENIQSLPIPPAIGTKLLALAIRMKNLGGMGNQLAELLDPPQNTDMPPAAQAAIAQLQGQLTQLQTENAALHADRAGRVLEQQTKVQIETMRVDLARFEKNIDYITQIVKAQLAAKSKADTTQAQIDAQRELDQLGFDHDQIDRSHDAAHDVAMAGVDHANNQDLAAQTAAAAAAAAAAQPAAGQPGSGA